MGMLWYKRPYSKIRTNYDNKLYVDFVIKYSIMGSTHIKNIVQSLTNDEIMSNLMINVSPHTLNL